MDDTFVGFGSSQISNVGAFMLYSTGSRSLTAGAIQAIRHDSTGDVVWYFDGNGNARQASVTGIVIDTSSVGIVIDVTHASVSGLVFKDNSYGLVLVSGGSGSLTWRTKTATPGSNTTSLTFSQLSAEPTLFMCGISDNVASNIVRRVNVLTKWNALYYGSNFYKALGASSPSTVVYTNYGQSYSNGSLTLTSPSYQNNGYFASGSTYTLAYLTASDIS